MTYEIDEEDDESDLPARRGKHEIVEEGEADLPANEHEIAEEDESDLLASEREVIEADSDESHHESRDDAEYVEAEWSEVDDTEDSFDPDEDDYTDVDYRVVDEGPDREYDESYDDHYEDTSYDEPDHSDDSEPEEDSDGEPLDGYNVPEEPDDPRESQEGVASKLKDLAKKTASSAGEATQKAGDMMMAGTAKAADSAVKADKAYWKHQKKSIAGRPHLAGMHHGPFMTKRGPGAETSGRDLAEPAQYTRPDPNTPEMRMGARSPVDDGVNASLDFGFSGEGGWDGEGDTQGDMAELGFGFMGGRDTPSGIEDIGFGFMSATSEPTGPDPMSDFAGGGALSFGAGGGRGPNPMSDFAGGDPGLSFNGGFGGAPASDFTGRGPSTPEDELSFGTDLTFGSKGGGTHDERWI